MEYHMRAMPTPLRTTDLDSTQTCLLASSPSATLEPSNRVTHVTRLTPTEPHGARWLKSPDLNSGIHLTGVRRPAHEWLEAPRIKQSQGRKQR